MASSSSSLVCENPHTGREKAVIDQLVHGRDFAIQLQALLSSSTTTELNEDDDNGFGSVKADDLVSKIMASFSDTIYMLLDKDDDFISTSAAATATAGSDNNGNDGPFLADFQCPKSEDSEESHRSISTAVTHRDRRGCYKRRKNSKSWKIETPTLIDDGHQWRKYGQKAILKTKYPRNYFRCTHKYDQKCAATKQVQQTQEEPPLYSTTYFGNHTCRNILTSPELVLDCTSPTQNSKNSMLLSFNLTSKQSHNPFLPSPAFSNTSTTTVTTSTSVKQEFKEEILATLSVPYSNPENNDPMNDDGDHDGSSSDFVLPGFDHRSLLFGSHDIHGDGSFGSFIDDFEDDVLQHFN